MLSAMTSQSVMTKNYQLQFLPTATTWREEVDINEKLGWGLTILMNRKTLKTPLYFRSLIPLFEIDQSSRHVHFVPKNETYKTETLSEEDIATGMLQQDFIVRMQPIKEYTILVKLKSIQQATPRVLEPTEL